MSIKKVTLHKTVGFASTNWCLSGRRSESFCVSFWGKRPQSGHAECPSPSAEGETPFSAFLFVSFFFAPFAAKEKAANDLCFLYVKIRETPTCVFPSFVCDEIHPSWRLRTIETFRPLRRATNGSAFRFRKPFEKGLTENFQYGFAQLTDKSKFEDAFGMQNLKNQPYTVELKRKIRPRLWERIFCKIYLKVSLYSN